MARRKIDVRSALAIVLAGAASTAAIAGETLTYTYDSLGRLIVARSNGSINNNQTSSWCFDAAGNRTLVRTSASGATANCLSVSTPAPSPTPIPTPTPTPAPSIAINNASATEGSSLLFAVSLSQAYSSTVTVNYATAFGTAGSGDFYAKSGALTFNVGQTTKTITVSTKQDIQMESSETFTVNLSGPTGGATISVSQGVGTIFDDGDGGPMCGDFFC